MVPRSLARYLGGSTKQRRYIQRVRYFLTGGSPPLHAVLLVESGSRGTIEKAIVSLRRNWGDELPVDLVTCFGGLPQGFRAETTRIFGVADYRGREGRKKLYRKLAENRYTLVGIVCSGEPLMTKWKWVLTLRLPAKIFVINENGDYFWLDWRHWSNIRQFVLTRAGMGGVGAVRTLCRALSFPFTLLYLLLYATTVHARRALRRG